jgi:hypothetical protein
LFLLDQVVDELHHPGGRLDTLFQSAPVRRERRYAVAPVTAEGDGDLVEWQVDVT